MRPQRDTVTIYVCSVNDGVLFTEAEEWGQIENDQINAISSNVDILFYSLSVSLQDQKKLVKNKKEKQPHRLGARCFSRQPSVYLKSGESEAPSFVMTEARSFHTTSGYRLTDRSHCSTGSIAARLTNGT